MRRQSMKMALVGGAVALIILFGIDMASSGIERVYGPVEGSVQAVNPAGYSSSMLTDSEEVSRVSDAPEVTNIAQLPENQVDQTTQRRTVADAQHGRTEEEIRQEYERKLQEELNKRLTGLPDLRSDATVNKVADGTAGVLQTVSAKGIRMVVSFFESVTD
ncbi:hypothetical protein [Paenibacillus sp. CF384]|uniref:hypothetical protein n=1 Tax=Paenibacillus sp. CF384 TaxID=1884382 RepID=UPI0008954176|nr:hypothetical protein [Paenibacillus sp. CF384]SDW89445.1 hypothetical protein SAMN05518855_1006191 [Paenibacillus sp. CF384]